MKWSNGKLVGSYKKKYNIMERDPRNTHEQVYIDMSIIVIDIKKKCFLLASIWIVECIPSLRNNLWCYPTSRVFLYSWCLLCVIVSGFIIRMI